MKKELNWYDISLNQYNRLVEALKIEDDNEKALEYASIVFGEDALDIPLSEFNKLLSKLYFLKTPIPEIVPPKHITINGRRYYVDCLIGRITASQYVDYSNYVKTRDLNKIISVFLIPESHKYNDGYDMLEVMKDIEDMPIIIVNAIAFFLLRQSIQSIEIFLRCSKKQLKKMDLPKKQKEMILKIMEAFPSSESSHIS